MPTALERGVPLEALLERIPHTTYTPNGSTSWIGDGIEEDRRFWAATPCKSCEEASIEPKPATISLNEEARRPIPIFVRQKEAQAANKSS